jgi:hypothetical protein
MKINKQYGVLVIAILVAITLLVLVTVTITCTSGDNTIILPSVSPEKGNPKLDSQLNQLVTAEKRGELDSFAKQNNIALVDGGVRVIIECVAGQLEKATEVAIAARAKQESSYDNLLQVVLPVTSLSSLSEEDSIYLIRLPQPPLPATIT